MSERSRRRAWPAAAALAALLGVACGGATPEQQGAPAPVEQDAPSRAPAAEAAGETGAAVTDARVVEVVSEKEATVRSLVATETPTMFWFWAPH